MVCIKCTYCGSIMVIVNSSSVAGKVITWSQLYRSHYSNTEDKMVCIKCTYCGSIMVIVNSSSVAGEVITWSQLYRSHYSNTEIKWFV